MAGAGRRPTASLIERLRASPQAFAFLQAVRVIERMAAMRARDGRISAPARVGLDHDPRQESLFLRSAVERTFPATEIAALEGDDTRPELSVTLMGLNGPSGVLPEFYSQFVMSELRQKNTALRDFLDVFNHRALSLFARAMEKYRLPLGFERAGYETQDGITRALYALVGMGDPSLRRRQAVADATLLFYGGHFSHARPTALGLSQILGDYFEQPVTVAQFQGRWVELPESEQTVLGSGRTNPGRYAQLGVNAVAGARVWDVQGAFRVKLGPLDYREFSGFMPSGARMAELGALVRSYVGPALSFDVQLTLKAEEIPPLRLSSDKETGPRLGWNSWLPTGRRQADASDAVFRVENI
ncbi:MAG TPA: type VI secretion system baseplate subunit TssG [Micropepsaceae bacterium]|jgi:type VI secretion system protein ImpH|nr:type VI secretion system baseplate subunit TssG [Micropepsaceae bacterium]